MRNTNETFAFLGVTLFNAYFRGRDTNRRVTFRLGKMTVPLENR